ncbi:DNA-binding GntR family transcriptional regulator [Evansella vedderi]|uniref:DNA-binding GntR family transcriptional regulator n=1 Tax=Evansella vedderi TaxID=38282 RepID=A0ABT9ZS79_9BACI|nr:GntR family transcriptional regulator [Evansella vedderi]MDQ0253030.1 DNA-binding GntR family transcriptional regulator [Evansella vedderi]
MSKEKSVQSESPVFLYEQVKIRIKEMIANGEIVPGRRLPNETELCEMFDTSRITIRRALKELASEGVIEIIHGKGTFVKMEKRQLHILNLKGFTEGGLGLTEENITKEILVKEIEMADEKLMKLFEREEPFKILKLVRLIRDADVLLSFDSAYFPCDIYPGIEELIQDNVSTFDLINNKYGVKFKKARKEMDFIQPTGEISEALDISSVEPVIQIEKLIRDDKDIPVHYSIYYLPANRIKFYIDVDM